MNHARTKRISPVKWMLGVAAFIVVLVGAGAIGMNIRPGGPEADADAAAAELPVATSIFGFFMVLVGVVACVVVTRCNCFIWVFTQPVVPAFKTKLSAANLVVGLPLQIGTAFIFQPWIARALANILPSKLLFPIAFLIPFAAASIFLAWFQMWQPLILSVIRKRLEAYRFTSVQLAAGLPMGVSDPDKSSMKKYGLVEEDFGMLWITPEQLTYRGDLAGLDIRPCQLLRIERKADAGSTSAYFGAVHVILLYLNADGGEQRVRFHPQGAWTMSGTAKALDELAERIEDWSRRTGAANLTASAAPAS